MILNILLSFLCTPKLSENLVSETILPSMTLLGSLSVYTMKKDKDIPQEHLHFPTVEESSTNKECWARITSSGQRVQHNGRKGSVANKNSQLESHVYQTDYTSGGILNNSRELEKERREDLYKLLIFSTQFSSLSKQIIAIISSRA